MKVLMVGGGHASLLLMDYFKHVDYLTIVGIVDPNESAPGIERAKSLSLPTYRDMAMIANPGEIDMIIELTGNANVRHSIIENLQPRQHFMSSDAARIMCDFIQLQEKRKIATIDQLSRNFNHLAGQLKTSEEHIALSLQNVESVILSMHIITMNARIEAARAGEFGKAFEVVVQAMQGTMSDIQKALQDITKAAEKSKETIADLLQSERQLKETLSAGK